MDHVFFVDQMKRTDILPASICTTLILRRVLLEEKQNYLPSHLWLILKFQEEWPRQM